MTTRWTFQGTRGYLDDASKGQTPDVRRRAADQPALGATAGLLSQACTADPSHRAAMIEQAGRRGQALRIAADACDAMIADVKANLDMPDVPDEVEGPPGGMADGNPKGGRRRA